MTHDEIRITGLALHAHLGVPDAERAQLQTVEADVIMRLRCSCDDLRDDLAGTIDYDAVARRLRALATERPRRLIETLAADIAACVLGEFGAAAVSVEIRKRILPGTDHVAARLHRNASF
ncbi:MAG: dihydroneopterin aldolase [Verrucomicrobiaceae bacterium]|nr:dihydroneopterin aldolase [Verrucomicrobiaceae bacterium]